MVNGPQQTKRQGLARCLSLVCAVEASLLQLKSSGPVDTVLNCPRTVSKETLRVKHLVLTQCQPEIQNVHFPNPELLGFACHSPLSLHLLYHVPPSAFGVLKYSLVSLPCFCDLHGEHYCRARKTFFIFMPDT